VAARARRRSTRPVRKTHSKKRGTTARFVSLLRGLLTTIILVGAGILIGSFWGEWPITDLVSGAIEDPVPRPLAERIKVEVLNGSGESGLAQRISNRLRDLGLDVVAAGNADHFDHETTYVLDRSGRIGVALEVARGLGTDSVVVALNPDLYLDATVVVGHDWASISRRD